MKLYYVLPLCLLSGFVSAAGIYEIDRSQWEAKPAAAAATKPKPRASAATQPQSTTDPTAQPTTPVASQAQPSTSQDMAQTCQPGHPCNDLQ